MDCEPEVTVAEPMVTVYLIPLEPDPYETETDLPVDYTHRGHCVRRPVHWADQHDGGGCGARAGGAAHAGPMRDPRISLAAEGALE